MEKYIDTRKNYLLKLIKKQIQKNVSMCTIQVSLASLKNYFFVVFNKAASVVGICLGR